MNKPLVSVIMPVYNGEKYIKQAVDSVYEQGVSLELLVIDDGSTDQSCLPMRAERTFSILRTNRIWARQAPETEE